MKTYNKTFICTLPVQQLAEKLMKTMHVKPAGYDVFLEQIDADPQSFLNSEIEDDESIYKDCIQYHSDVAYYTRVTESIMDSIADNGDACSHLFSTLNGWIKEETPEEKTLAQDELVKSKELCYGMSVNINKLPDYVAEEYNFNADWWADGSRRIFGSISSVKGDNARVTIAYVNTKNYVHNITIHVALEKLSQCSDVTLSSYKTENTNWIEDNC